MHSEDTTVDHNHDGDAARYVMVGVVLSCVVGMETWRSAAKCTWARIRNGRRSVVWRKNKYPVVAGRLDSMFAAQLVWRHHALYGPSGLGTGRKWIVQCSRTCHNVLE